MTDAIKTKLRFLINLYHLAKSNLLNFFYGFPSKKIKLIGITGTDGKTTTTHLVYHALTKLGKKASMISTVYAKIGEKKYDTGFHVTTPDAFTTFSYIRKSIANKDEYFILETTSHRLEQNQLSGLDFAVGLITNITHEHLDYHGRFDNYVEAKSKLLSQSKTKIINLDDESSLKIKKLFPKVKTFGFFTKADYSYSGFSKDMPLFNRYNYLAAYAILKELGFDKAQILEAMEGFVLPKGRLEIVFQGKYKVLIDFAHTPNAVFSLLKDLKEKTPLKSGRLIHVFGSAGLRDREKRPLMGKSSGEFCDIAILTEEDYRTEDPEKICKQISSGLIEKGFKKITTDEKQNIERKSFMVELDRSKAIELALSIAKKGDLVVLTGKAHEQSLCRGNKEYPYDEHLAVEKALQKVSKQND